MSFTRKTILILLLTSTLAGAAFAQEAATETTTTTTTAAETAAGDTTSEAAETTTANASAAAIETDFQQILARHPQEVTRILAVDPTMLANDPFLARYPELADFVAKHPQLRRNPHYYLRSYEYYPQRPRAPFEEFFETMAIVGVFALIAFALSWLVRTIIEQKRWNRLALRQSEVHNKILDRFATSEEVLQYVKSPAGTKFLESAPIPLHAEKPTQSAPLTRIMWSIQLGVVVAVAAFGMLLVSLRFEGDAAESLFAMGAIGFCVGAGFIASAVVSLVLSRRLGLWQDSATGPAGPIDEPGHVR